MCKSKMYLFKLDTLSFLSLIFHKVSNTVSDAVQAEMGRGGARRVANQVPCLAGAILK